jgi:hypothetical protein
MPAQAFLATVVALPTIVNDATSAESAWMVVRQQMDDTWQVVDKFPEVDIDSEVSTVADQLRRVFAVSPPPEQLQLLWFGLFAAADVDTLEERAGYYVSGTTHPMPHVESSSELSAGVLDYSPDDRYLASPLLERIKVAALASESDYNNYDYGLMLCAASIISFFAAREVGIDASVVVGFDSGDAIQFPARTSNTR